MPLNDQFQTNQMKIYENKLSTTSDVCKNIKNTSVQNPHRLYYTYSFIIRHFKKRRNERIPIHRHSTPLSVHDGADEVLVVDVTLVVLMACEELFRLLVAELLPEGREKVPQLGRRDEPVPVLVEVTKTLDEVLTCIS